jgi:hypothetical protein
MIILIAMLLRKVGMDQPIPFHKPNKKKVSEKMMDHPSLNISARVFRGGTMTGTQGGLRSSTLEDGVGYSQG